jgi:predicted nucleotidyltransferase
MVLGCIENDEIIKNNIANSIQRDGNWFNEITHLNVSGSHLYGYAHKDSDIDVRGGYIMPLDRIMGIGHTKYVVERNLKLPGTPLIDIQVFDIKKEVELVISNNSGVYENIFAPQFKTTPEHTLLKSFATLALTTRIYFPFRGWAVSEFDKHIVGERREGKYGDIHQKHILSVIRLLMAGSHVLETGKIESNAFKLADFFDDKLTRGLIYSQMVDGDRTGFKKEEIEMWVDKIQNYFLRIDLAAQESTELFHDDGTADQKQRAALKQGVFFAANDLLKNVRMKNSEGV